MRKYDETKPYARIFVQFLTPSKIAKDTAKAGSRSYAYFVTEKAYHALGSITWNSDYPVLKLTSADGYSYHGSEVVLLNRISEDRFSEEHKKEDIPIKLISKIELTGYIIDENTTWNTDNYPAIMSPHQWLTITRKGTPTEIYKRTYCDEVKKVSDYLGKVVDNLETAKDSLNQLAAGVESMKITNDTYQDNEIYITSASPSTSGFTYANKLSRDLDDYSFFYTDADSDFQPSEYWKKYSNVGPIVISPDSESTVKYVTINEKENNSMFENVFKGLDFGRANSVKTSIYGPAFKCGDCYVSYDKSAENYIDVTELLLEIDNMNYKMPIAAGAVAVGDYILHMHKWVRVLKVLKGGRLEVEDMQEKQVVTILPVKNVFGFEFYTKLFCFADNLISGCANAENPFGNLLPLMLMSKDNSKDNLLPLMLMSGGFNGGNAQMNPLMMYALMGNKGNDNTLLMLMMMNGGNGFNFPSFRPAIGFESHPSNYDKKAREDFGKVDEDE